MKKYTQHIELIKLRPTMYSISCRMVGEKLFQDEIAFHNSIKGDILECFGDMIVEVILGLDIENVDDTRTYKQVVIFNADLLLRFKNIDDNNQTILEIIIGYLNQEFVRPITTKNYEKTNKR